GLATASRAPGRTKMPESGPARERSPSQSRSPLPERTKRTSSQSGLRQAALLPGATSSTEREIASAPRSRPTCRQTRTPSCARHAPSRRSKARHPPASSTAMSRESTSARVARRLDYSSAVADPDARIDAKNRDFAHFEQVKKEQEYRLAEAEAAEQFDEAFRIRTCDLEKFFHGTEEDRRAFAQELGEGLEQIGFAILEGHGVDPRLYEEASAKTVEVFTRP